MPTLSAEVGHWNEAFAELVENRWVHCPDVISNASALVLANEPDLDWEELVPEGVAFQNGTGALKQLTDTSEEVRSFVEVLHQLLDQAAQETVRTRLPQFNEANWSHYPAGVGRISAHRDPDDFTGLIAIFTLVGSALFRVFERGGHRSEIRVSAGDLVLITAHQWPHAASTCPVHEVDPPGDGDRMILTLRSNRNGPGGGYSVGTTT